MAESVEKEIEALTSEQESESEGSQDEIESKSEKKRKEGSKKREPKQPSKSKRKEKAEAKERERKDVAKNQFNQFFSQQFGADRWAKLLPSLLRPTRYSCLINKYADPEDVARRLSTMTGLRPLPFLTVPCLVVDNLEAVAPFPPPEKGMNNVLPYYLLDAASVLVTEALGVEPKDRVLDICAAPGGKSVSILQRLDLTKGGSLTSNEVATERRLRLRNVLLSYVPQVLHSKLSVTGVDATKWADHDFSLYDKVLVDAPCSSERHLLHDSTGEKLTEWSPSHAKLSAQRQFSILLEAIKAVKPGGTVVYATCSLNILENDDVVQKALSKSKVSVEVAEPRRSWPIGEPTKFGWIVLPDEGGNGWGPLYFCVLRRGIEEEDSGSDWD